MDAGMSARIHYCLHMKSIDGRGSIRSRFGRGGGGVGGKSEEEEEVADARSCKSER